MGTSTDQQRNTKAEWPQEIRKLVVPSAAPAKPPSSHRLRRRYGRGDMRFVPAHSVRLLVNAAEAYPEMLAAIDGATDHVELETYTLRDDSVGRRFQQALVHASSRGVRVRLLYDWLGSLALPGRFVRELVEAGVAVSAYHPLVWRRPVWALNKRDHRKMLIVDDAVSFTGGLNLGEEYLTGSHGAPAWRDTHLRLDGPAVAREMLALFEYAWRWATPYSKTLTRRTRIGSRIRQRMTTMPRRRRRPVVPPGATGEIAVSIVGNELLRHRRRIRRTYLRAIRGAQRYVLIENAYFIPSTPVRRALIEAVRRGVFVGVVVGAESDVPITTCAMRWLYEHLLAGGVRLFEWPDSVMHAKTAVIDDAWSIVGSYNFDHRALQHQLESVAVVADSALAGHLRDQTLADIARCREVVLDTHRRRPWREKARQYLAYLVRHWL